MAEKFDPAAHDKHAAELDRQTLIEVVQCNGHIGFRHQFRAADCHHVGGYSIGGAPAHLATSMLIRGAGRAFP